MPTNLDPRQIIDITQDPYLSKQRITKISVKSYVIPKYHLKPDKIDTRDYKYVPTRSTMPATIDLRPYCTEIENQGNLGSCTGQSISSSIELLDKRNNKPLQISPLFIYYYERLLEGTVNFDNGASLRNGIKVVNKYGAPLEKLWPYDITKFRVTPNTIAMNDAASRKVTLYERAANLNACLNALSNGYAVNIGFLVYSSFEYIRSNGIMTYPNTKRETLLGGHAVLLVGYDYPAKRFIVRNSWGVNWGDNGYFYMPFSVIQDTKMSFDFWVIKTVENP